MGFNIDLTAIRGKTIEEVHSILNLRSTSHRESVPESPVVAAALPTGWYLVYFNDGSPPWEKELARLSEGAEAIALHVSETVMSSCAYAWQNGREKWSISHNLEGGGADDLEHGGSPPDCYFAIAERLRKQQQERGDADYVFDIPVEVVRELTGFSYDGNPNGYPVDEFIVLERIKPPRQWWRFW
jgi:hypothetical protein